VCLFDEVFGEFGVVAVSLKCFLVFIKPYQEASTGLPYMCLIAIMAHQLVHCRLCVFADTCCLCISNLSMVLLVCSAIFKSVFFNGFVMTVVSLPMCVKVVHLLCAVVVTCLVHWWLSWG
jgi:hypothetical protein